MALVLNFTTIIYLQKKNYDERMNTKNKRGHTKGIQSRKRKKQTKKYIKGGIQRKNIQKICEAKKGKVYTHTAFLHSTFLRYPY